MQKKMPRRRNAVVGGILGMSLVGLGVAVASTAAATPAAAAPAAPAAAAIVANSCHSEIQEKIQWPLDPEYRVVAWCDTLDAGMKARGTMDMHWAPDDHTEWFTDTGNKHYSSWHAALWGITPKSRVDLATS